MQAQTDLTTAYNFAAAEACGSVLSGVDLGGQTLTSGVYCFAEGAQLTGTLTLDAQGDPAAAFVFQIGSTLTTASASSILFTNGGKGSGLFWQVGSSATLGTTTAFAGSILALHSITLNTGATIQCGRALASIDAVTMDTNTISTGCDAVDGGGGSVPEPGTAALVCTGGVVAWLRLRPRFVQSRCGRDSSSQAS
jgi:type VI secretion system secreted protein VgrG